VVVGTNRRIYSLYFTAQPGAPVLYAHKRTGKKGKLMQITSRLAEDGFIVADGIFDTLELRLGSGDEMERVTITRGI
jgi:hypothetical protein